MDSFITLVVFWLSMGVFFAFAELVENAVTKLFRSNDLPWKDIVFFTAITIIIWPLMLIALVMQIFFKQTFERMGKYLKRRTQFWAKPDWLSEAFHPAELKLKLCEVATEIWKKPGYEYDSHIDLYVYHNKKTGMMRIAYNHSTSGGKFVLCERYSAWIGQHNLFNHALTQTYEEKK